MPSDPRLLLCRQYPCQQLAYEIESAAVGLPFGVRAPIAGTLPVREASAPSGADAAPSAGKRLVAGADCDGGVPRGTPSRSEERRVGKERVSTCRHRGAQTT